MWQWGGYETCMAHGWEHLQCKIPDYRPPFKLPLNQLLFSPGDLHFPSPQLLLEQSEGPVVVVPILRHSSAQSKAKCVDRCFNVAARSLQRPNRMTEFTVAPPGELVL